MTTLTKAQQAERAEAIEKLREWIKPGDTVYTILRHVSRSGMLREIGVVLIDSDGDTLHPNWMVATALGRKMSSGWTDGIKCHGAGMDMGFDLVYSLSLAIYPDYQCLGEKCPSNAHVNPPRPARDGKMMHHDGYALNHRWL